MSREITIARAMDRLAVLAHPPRGEPSPVRSGASPARWAELAGIGGTPHDLLHPLQPLATGDDTPEQVALEALRKLVNLGIVEGWPDAACYRPVRGAARRAGSAAAPTASTP